MNYVSGWSYCQHLQLPGSALTVALQYFTWKWCTDMGPFGEEVFHNTLVIYCQNTFPVLLTFQLTSKSAYFYFPVLHFMHPSYYSHISLIKSACTFLAQCPCFTVTQHLTSYKWPTSNFTSPHRDDTPTVSRNNSSHNWICLLLSHTWVSYHTSSIT